MSQQRGGRRGPTIRDVAAAAGVSKSLVSMVFNDDPRVSDARRELVLAAADRLGFSPNWMARSLAAGDGDFVGVMVPDLTNPIFAEILEDIRSELRDVGRRTLVSSALFTDARGNREFDASVLTVLRDMHPSSLVVIGSVPSLAIVQPLMQRVPTVVASGTAEDLDHVRVVRNDDVIGIDLIVDHLVERGHRRIAHVGGEGGGAASNRLTAFLQAMRRHGLADQARVERSDYSTQRAAEATRRLLTRDGGADAFAQGAGLGGADGDMSAWVDMSFGSGLGGITGAGRGRQLLGADERPTAIVAVNDLAAIGVISAAEQLGVHVPRDLAVTGYDNTSLSAIDRISLTTVDPCNADIARETVRLLRDAKGPFEGHRERFVLPSLVVRDSTSAS